jgi:hypothetical protein
MTQVLEHHRQHYQRHVLEPPERQDVPGPACTGRTELFFSERTADMRSAQVICASCSVRDACLEQARERPPFAGVWGGVVFVNGEEQLLKRGRGRPRKSEELDNARVLKALADQSRHSERSEESQELNRHIA